MTFDYENALKNYEQENKKGVVTTNSAVKTAYCWNVANALGKPSPERNHYLYTNILMFLTIPDLKARLKKELGDNYESIMKTVYSSGYNNNRIIHYENVLSKLQSVTQAHLFIKKVLKKQIPEICAQSFYLEPWLMRVHTFLVMSSDCKDLSIPKEWVLQARDYKTQFHNDPRLQHLINTKTSHNTEQNNSQESE